MLMMSRGYKASKHSAVTDITQALTKSAQVPFRKAYLQSIIDVVEVDDTQIRIKGSKEVLEKAVLASRAGTIRGSQMSTRWRATVDEDGQYSFAVAL
jgi:hypothetical protein